MTDGHPEDGEDAPEDADRWGNRTSEDDGGSDSWLSNLLSALERLEEFSSSSRREESTGLDYDVSIRSGLENLGSDRAGDDVETRSTPDRERSTGDRRTRYRRSTTDYHVTTRTREDELIVTADLGEVDPEDVTVGFDDDAVVIGVEGRQIDRVRLPWTRTTADAAVRNGILTVTVSPEGSP